MEIVSKPKVKYHCPDIKAREILKFILENPDYRLRTGGRGKLTKLFAEKFQRTDRTIRNYIRILKPELNKIWEAERKKSRLEIRRLSRASRERLIL